MSAWARYDTLRRQMTAFQTCAADLRTISVALRTIGMEPLATKLDSIARSLDWNVNHVTVTLVPDRPRRAKEAKQ